MISKEKLTAEQRKSIKDQIAEFENQNAKPTPEERFLQLMSEIDSIKVDPEKYPNSIFYFKGDDFWGEYDAKNNVFWLSKHVWSFFDKEYGYKFEEIKDLTSSMVEKHFKRKEVTASPDITFLSGEVEEHFKRK